MPCSTLDNETQISGDKEWHSLGHRPRSKIFVVDAHKRSYMHHVVISTIVIGLLSLTVNEVLIARASQVTLKHCLLLIFYPSCAVSAFLCLWWSVDSETLLVTSPLSVQLTTTYFSGQETVLFIPWYRVKDLLIIDVITGQRVLYFLAVQLHQDEENTKSHEILFKATRPRLARLEEIYNEVQRLIDYSR